MRHLAYTTLAAGLLLLSNATAWAQDTSDLDALLGETVSTTASKSAQTGTAVPALTINITAQDLRRHGITTLAQAYNFLALGIVSEDPLGDPEVGSRGVLLTNDAGKHILLMIDGHVTNDQLSGASYHGQAAGLPLELIDHIEIMLGPGSVLYGSNAMLGVVNVVTKQVKDYGGVHLIAEGGLTLPQNDAHVPVSPTLTNQYLRSLGETYRLGAGIGKTFQTFGRATELTAQLEYFALRGPSLGWPIVITPNSSHGPRDPIGVWGGTTTSDSYHQQTPSGYLRLERGNLQLTLHALANRASAPYARAQERTADFDDPQSFSDRRYGGFDLSWSNVVSEAVSVVARMYGDASQRSSQIRASDYQGCLGSQPNGCIHTSRGHAQWLGAEIRTTLTWLSDRSMSSMLGVEGRVTGVGFQSGLSDIATGAPVSTYGQYSALGDSAAVYAQQVWSPSPRFSLNAGARMDVDYEFGSRVSPRVAAVADLWRGGTAKLIYSEAFRAPTPEERHLADPYLVLAADHLDPEIARSAEALIQQRFGAHRMVLGVFRSWWENMVFRERLSQAEFSAAQRAGLIDSSTLTVFQFRNVARIDNYGLNAGYEGAGLDGRLSFGANFNWTYARIENAQGSNLITVIPSIYGNARLSYEFGDHLPVVSLASQVSNKRLADDAHDPGVITTRYAPPMVDFRLTLSGRISRLRDIQYRICGDFAFTASNPYAATPNAGNPDVQVLIPVSRGQLFIGLQYDFK